MNPETSTLLIMPESPIAFDGKYFFYSKGGKTYIDNLSRNIKKVILLNLVCKSNDPHYSFRAAVKDLFDGFNQNCYDCKDPLALRICSLIN